MAWKKETQTQHMELKTTPLQTEGEVGNLCDKPVNTTNSGNGGVSSGKRDIKEVIIMKKTVLHIYPDGQAHIQKHLCSEWIAGMNQVYKQKAKDKAIDKAKIMEIGKIEEATKREL